MRALNLAEIRQVRTMATPERLKQCGTAYSVALTYLPVLCEMAEKLVTAQARSFHCGQRIRYTIFKDSSGKFGIEGGDFKEVIGDEVLCIKLIEELNSVVVNG